MQHTVRGLEHLPTLEWYQQSLSTKSLRLSVTQYK